MTSEHRRATRVALNLPTVVESIGQKQVELHPNLDRVYKRVTPPTGNGTREPAAIRDLSTNGCFIAGPTLPLLSRVALSFDLKGFGRVEAIGWTLWLRSDDCEIPQTDRQPISLPKGIGLLFEAVPLDARLAIHRLVQRNVVN